MKIKPFIYFSFEPTPKLRSCETKPTGCVQNNERTSECLLPCSALSFLFVFLAAVCSFGGDRPQI